MVGSVGVSLKPTRRYVIAFKVREVGSVLVVLIKHSIAIVSLTLLLVLGNSSKVGKPTGKVSGEVRRTVSP